MPSYPGKAESVHLSSFPEVRREYLDESLNDRWERIWEIRAVVTKALEEARKEEGIGLSLDLKYSFSFRGLTDPASKVQAY
jgi:isoleucyl-tRNA synthetase